MLTLLCKFKNVSLAFKTSDSLTLRKIEKKSVDFRKGNILTLICNGVKTKSAQTNPFITSEVEQTSCQLQTPSTQCLSVFKPLTRTLPKPSAFEKIPLPTRSTPLSMQQFSIQCIKKAIPFALKYPSRVTSKLPLDQALLVFDHSTLFVNQSRRFSDQSRPFNTCMDDPASLKPDPVTGLTPKMVNLLKCLAVAIKPDLHLHAVNVFKRVFHMDRNIQRMFPKFPCDDICALEQNPDFNKHVDAVMKALVYTLEVSGSVPDLRSNLALQRTIHKDLCIPDRHFITFGNAINEYLKETLGVRYTEDVECAVAYWWRYLATEMTAKPEQTKCAQCGATILKPEGKRSK